MVVFWLKLLNFHYIVEYERLGSIQHYLRPAKHSTPIWSRASSLNAY